MTVRCSRQALRAQAEIPPIVAAIVRLAEPHYIGLPSGFIDAWNAAPALVAEFTDETSDEPRFRLVDRLSGVKHAKEYPDTDPEEDHGLAAAFKAVQSLRGDHYTNLVCPIADAAFYIGIAYASYVLTKGGARC